MPVGVPPSKKQEGNLFYPQIPEGGWEESYRGLERKNEWLEHQILGLLPPPKANSGRIQFSLSSAFFS